MPPKAEGANTSFQKHWAVNHNELLILFTADNKSIVSVGGTISLVWKLQHGWCTSLKNDTLMGAIKVLYWDFKTVMLQVPTFVGRYCFSDCLILAKSLRDVHWYINITSIKVVEYHRSDKSWWSDLNWWLKEADVADKSNLSDAKWSESMDLGEKNKIFLWCH